MAVRAQAAPLLSLRWSWGLSAGQAMSQPLLELVTQRSQTREVGARCPPPQGPETGGPSRLPLLQLCPLGGPLASSGEGVPQGGVGTAGNPRPGSKSYSRSPLPWPSFFPRACGHCCPRQSGLTRNQEEGAQPFALCSPQGHSQTCLSPSPHSSPTSWSAPSAPAASIQPSVHLSVPLFHAQLLARHCPGVQGCPAKAARALSL